MGVDFTDSHWRGPICRCVPHNPFVTASPCHLPLHKGGFSACYKSKPPRGLYPSRRFLSKKLAFAQLLLAIAANYCYNFLGKQKCGSLWVRQHPQACAGANPPTQRSKTAPHGILYARTALFTRGGFNVPCFCAALGRPFAYALCRSLSCTAFLFSPGVG